MDTLSPLLQDINFLLIIATIAAFLLASRIFPAIIFLSHTKNLMDEPGQRSMHVNKTPTLGGIGIFITFSVILMLFAILANLPQQQLLQLVAVIAGMIILLFLGIKDDLLVLSPAKKLIGQIFAAMLVVLLTDTRIHDFGGLFGIGELPDFLSILFSIFVFVFIVNAFNLTDGIDGLASCIAMVTSGTFGIYFIINNNHLMALTSFILIGSVLSFLKFNLSKKSKIFMGDSGSMFIGFLLAFQAVTIFGMNNLTSTTLTFNNEQLVVLSILAFPILDTTRVFLIRIKQGKSPFSADRNHIHHRLLDLGMSHRCATFVISIINIVIIATTLIFDAMNLNVHVHLLLVVTGVPFLYLFPFFVEQQHGKIRFAAPKQLSS